jgi:hypothetical protein
MRDFLERWKREQLEQYGVQVEVAVADICCHDIPDTSYHPTPEVAACMLCETCDHVRNSHMQSYMA